MNTLIRRYHKFFALGLLVFWNFSLIAYRIHVTETHRFISFLWNLFLAIVPYLSSEAAVFLGSKNKRFTALVFVLLAILFLPNSPYLITDLFHLHQGEEMPLWFDTMVIFSLALSGLALFYVTLFNIKNVLRLLWGSILAEITILLVIFLCSFGIYLGRFLRFNSWDLLSNTNDLLEEIANPIINPSVHTRAIGVTLLYGAFLMVGYLVIRLFQMGNERHFESKPNAD